MTKPKFSERTTLRQFLDVFLFVAACVSFYDSIVEVKVKIAEARSGFADAG